MGFLKKFILGSIALGFIFLGGAGTQTNSTLLQGSGFIGLILGLIALYIFGKMVWRAMGCLPSLLIILAVLLFILYAMGVFSGGLSNVRQNIYSIMGRRTSSEEVVAAQATAATQSSDDTKSSSSPSGASSPEVINLVGQDEHPILLENITDSILPKRKEPKKPSRFNPMDYPAINGVSRVVSGDTLTINNRIIKLFGVASPEIGQTCADSSGRGYRCGQQSVSWLSSWLADYELSCHILNENEQGILTAVCLLGDYDIGAAIINSGWAVADIRQTKIYLPYQQQAAANKRGLWQGKFYMPWDWQRIQNRKANIKVVKPKKSGRRKVWSNPFGD